MTGHSKHGSRGAATKSFNYDLAKITTMCFEDHYCPPQIPVRTMWAIMVLKTHGYDLGQIVAKTFGRGATSHMLTGPSHGKFFLPQHVFGAPAPSSAMESTKVSMPSQNDAAFISEWHAAFTKDKRNIHPSRSARQVWMIYGQ